MSFKRILIVFILPNILACNTAQELTLYITAIHSKSFEAYELNNLIDTQMNQTLVI